MAVVTVNNFKYSFSSGSIFIIMFTVVSECDMFQYSATFFKPFLKIVTVYKHKCVNGGRKKCRHFPQVEPEMLNC